MGDSEINSLASQMEFLMETEADFQQRLKQRLVLESNKVANPFTFVGKLLTNGVLSDGSNDSEASCGWKEMMVQSALMIACSKGAEATRGLMQALQESDNSALISGLRAWVNENLGTATVPDLSEPQEGDAASRIGTSEKLAKTVNSTNEKSSVGTKFIDKILSHVCDALIDQLQGHLVGKASRIVNAGKICSSLISQKVMDHSAVQLKAGPQAQEWIENAIKAACSKKAIASLVIALEHSGNELILEEAFKWLDTSQMRRKNYPSIAVRSLADQPTEKKPKVMGYTFFEQAAPLDRLEKVAAFNCQPETSEEGTHFVDLNRDRMIAQFNDDTVKVWNWRDHTEKTIRFGDKFKDTTVSQYDEEILMLGTVEGTVHLLDGTTLEEKWSVRLGDRVTSLDFVESTLLVLTEGVEGDKLWRADISRSDMRLINLKPYPITPHISIDGFILNPVYTFLYNSNVVTVRSTKSGSPITDDQNHPCSLEAPTDIRTLNLVNLISTKRVVIAGCEDGVIAMWSTCKLKTKQAPLKTFQGHTEEVVFVCDLKGHLLSLDKSGKLLMWSGYDLENEHIDAPVPRILSENFYSVTYLDGWERWFASCSSKDNKIRIWTLPDLWLLTG